MTKRPVTALILAIALLGCDSGNSRPPGGTGGSSGSGGSAGAGGSGGGSGSGGTSVGGSGGSAGSGGAGGGGAGGGGAGGGGAGGTGGAGGRDGSAGGAGGSAADAGRDGGGGMSTEAAAFFKATCECPVLTGFTPAQFCEAYTEICGYTGTKRYASEAACKTSFKGGASDSDGRKAGALCCAYKMPDMKEARCQAAGP